jgi:hypothetical protein
LSSRPKASGARGRGEPNFLAPKTDIQRERQRRALDALSLKRRHPELSMTEAAHRSGTTLKTIRRYAGGALQMRSGRIDVLATDTIAREMRMLTPQGEIDVTVRNSRDARRIARHHNAVRKFVMTRGGDTSKLRPFVGKTLKAGGETYTFLTDPATINRLARAGELHFLDIYSSTGGA